MILHHCVEAQVRICSGSYIRNRRYLIFHSRHFIQSIRHFVEIIYFYFSTFSQIIHYLNEVFDIFFKLSATFFNIPSAF